MSRTIFEDESGLYVHRFFGGVKKGPCYQIGVKATEYIQLSRPEALEMVLRVFAAIVADIHNDLETLQEDVERLTG